MMYFNRGKIVDYMNILKNTRLFFFLALQSIHSQITSFKIIKRKHKALIMKTILIPVDFSEHAGPTYKFATRLAGTVEKTRLFFFHSFNDQLLIPDSTLNSGFDNDTFMNMQLIEEFKEQAENNISQLKN